MFRTISSLATALLLASPSGAQATTLETSAPSSFHADFEIDPTAYVLSGHSLHVGLGWKRLRADLGAYGLSLPAAVTGNDDFDVAFHGYGLKLQYFPFAEQRGGFVGVDAGVNRPLVRRKGTDLASTRTEYSAGVNFGWRFVFAEHFYATAWLGLGYALNGKPVTLGESTYQGNRLIVFPAIHLGYRFR